MPIQQLESTINATTEFLSRNLASKKAVVGISGGIDSAVVLMLLTRSIPRDSIIAVFMPDNGTPEEDRHDVRKLSDAAGVPISTVSIQPMVDSFCMSLSATDKKAIGNMKSRVRMTTLYYLSNINNGMVVGTTNRTENLIGYFTKYGDGGCDIEPIIGLYKREVRQLAGLLDVPTSIIDKKPSAGLWANQYDEEELGMSYDDLDGILSDLFEMGTGEISDRHIQVNNMYKRSEHKRKMPLARE